MFEVGPVPVCHVPHCECEVCWIRHLRDRRAEFCGPFSGADPRTHWTPFLPATLRSLVAAAAAAAPEKEGCTTRSDPAGEVFTVGGLEYAEELRALLLGDPVQGFSLLAFRGRCHPNYAMQLYVRILKTTGRPSGRAGNGLSRR